jgi:hypothetical protein
VKNGKYKPAKRTHKSGSPAAQYDFVNHCQKLVAARIKAGLYHDDPALEGAIADFDPAIALIEIAANPANEPGLRGATAAKLLPFWHKEQSLMVKTADHAGTVINISIAAWAALPRSDGAPKAIESQPIDVTANDRELEAHGRSSVPAPIAAEAAGREYVELDEHRAPRILRTRTPLINHHTGQRWQGSPPETVTPVELGDGPFSKS